MNGIKIYTIDSKKRSKTGQPGWNPHQEQAKTYYSSIMKDNKCYKVQISDDKYCMTLYYHPQNSHIRHFNISNYVEDESDYILADKIVRWINTKVS